MLTNNHSNIYQSLHRTVIDLIDWIKKNGPRFLHDVLRDWGKGACIAEQQNEAKATLCRKFVKEDGLIDPFHDSIHEIRKKRQAFALWPKLYFYVGEKRVSIDGLQLHKEITVTMLDAQPLIVHNVLHIAVASIRLTPDGKKSLSREEFMNGYLLKN